MSVDKFKGSGAKWYTQGLFLETCIDNSTVLYTLQPWDKTLNGKPLLSIHKLYVEAEDVGEFNFANKYFAGYYHWLKVKASPWFKEPYAAMVAELNAKLRSRSIKSMLSSVEAGEASQQTLKYLADNDYIPKEERTKRPVGRPQKEEKKASVVSLVKNDLERLTK